MCNQIVGELDCLSDFSRQLSNAVRQIHSEQTDTPSLDVALNSVLAFIFRGNDKYSSVPRGYGIGFALSVQQNIIHILYAWDQSSQDWMSAMQI